MIENENKITISSEDELFSVLENYLTTGEISDKIDISNLPTLKIRLIGDKFDQSLTPNVMKGFVDMQAYINRTYRLAKYGDVDVKLLSKEEREALQLQVKVEKGSSIVDINFDGLWAQIGQFAAEKMTGTEFIILILGVAAIWATNTGIKRFLNNRKEVRLAEIKAEEDKKHLENIHLMSQEESKRAEIMANLIARTPMLENIDRQAYDANTSLFKALTSTQQIEIGETIIDTNITNELTKNARQRSKEIRLDGIYKLEQVNSSDPDVFKVKVRNISTNILFDAVLTDDFITGNRNKLLLMEAEWNRSPIKLSINAKILNEKIKDAIILSVEAI